MNPNADLGNKAPRLPNQCVSTRMIAQTLAVGPCSWQDASWLRYGTVDRHTISLHKQATATPRFRGHIHGLMTDILGGLKSELTSSKPRLSPASWSFCHARFLIDRVADIVFLRKAPLLVAALVVLTGCGEKSYDQIELMPSPEIYANAALDPFPHLTKGNFREQTRLFYVTDRSPADGSGKETRYNNARGYVLRAGTADVSINPPVEDWNQIRQITQSGSREQKYLLEMTGMNEFGVLPVSATRFLENPPSDQSMEAAGREFAKQINRQLAVSPNKDIFIYINGYNVDFEYPILVSKELQHFLGYQGAFISYNWPATPNRLAYFKDLETVKVTRRNLRELLQFLSDNTNARRINLIGYSMGSRLAFEVTYQIALMKQGNGGRTPRLGQVILLSSDLDRIYFGQALADGLLDVVQQLTIYMSGTDSALNVSRILFSRERLGQLWEEGDLLPGLEQQLRQTDKLSLIDVTDAERAGAGNGHWYFRGSPWASSDMFVSLLFGQSPGKRGLVRQEGRAVWEFPPDYPQRLSNALPQN